LVDNRHYHCRFVGRALKPPCRANDPETRYIICGKRGATLRLAAVEHDSKSYDHLPPAHSPKHERMN
jgi:hypothetical protein